MSHSINTFYMQIELPPSDLQKNCPSFSTISLIKFNWWSEMRYIGLSCILFNFLVYNVKCTLALIESKHESEFLQKNKNISGKKKSEWCNNLYENLPALISTVLLPYPPISLYCLKKTHWYDVVRLCLPQFQF